MADSATFLESVGGDGSTVTGDANPTTGLANGGHRKRFVNALAQVVAVAQHVVDTAEDVNVDKLAAQQAVVDAQGHASLASDKAGIATTKAGEAAASALAASNSATAASNSADESEYWAGQAGAIVTGGVKVSNSDTTAGTLDVKIVAGDGIAFKKLNSGGNESLMIYASSNLTGTIGKQGEQGFGVGVYPFDLPSGFSALAGTFNKASAEYGNYQYSDGSVMVFVPKFYYRIGHPSSPRYATYGLNAVDIVGIETFASEAAANAAGYALHRAFKDGGSVKSGFFVDKYLASKNGSTSCRSVKDGVPISLTASTSYTNSNGMVTSDGTCTGILADAILLSRSRGVGMFNVASIFIYDALATLSLAHGQESTSATHCDWYDATNNFPKGCNNGSLADANDSSVTFVTAGDSGATAKPKTGSGNPFAKTTHNGQACGVADLNGSMWQVMLGVTSPGSSATDTAQVANGNAYVLKTSVALSSLRAGWNGTNDAWGDATNLATKYDLISGFFPWGSATGLVYFGNGSNQVFSGATSGTSYLRKCCGVQETTAGASASGTNQFGADGCYQYNKANLLPLGSGVWSDAANAGVFYRYWNSSRSGNSMLLGFRAAAYGL